MFLHLCCSAFHSSIVKVLILACWLLPGLIPLGVGGALVISYYLGQDNQPPHLDLLDEPQVKD